MSTTFVRVEIEQGAGERRSLSSERSGAVQAARWTIAGLIKLIDDAIDSAGAQLARSEGLRPGWTDDEASVRPISGRRAVRMRIDECAQSDGEALIEHEIDLA